MRQIVQNYKTGELKIEQVPPPALQPGGILVRNAFSVISAGTERAKIELGRKGLMGKSRARPDQLRKVLESARREGFWKTYRKVMNKLDALTPLGYSCAGEAIQSGAGAEHFRPGDHVACAGGGYANHAEIVFVPVNLCARVPDGVPLDQAAFCTLGAIAMQGLRQARITLGENVVLIGLGLLGQLGVQLLQAAGCRVFGIDLKPELMDIARQMGAKDTAMAGQEGLVQKVMEFTDGYGADAVIITAASTGSEPVRLAGELLRDRGRVVVVGNTGMDVPREDYYQKELSINLSRSYGPGRYDTRYEEKGIDYPIGYVRWTEQRNMKEFLQLLADGSVRLEKIITHRFPIERGLEAYQMISGRKQTPYLGVLLEYPSEKEPAQTRIQLSERKAAVPTSRLRAGLIGAGSYAQGTLLAHLSRLSDVTLVSVADADGAVARGVADKFGVDACTSDNTEVLADPDVDCVFIATRHDSHADLVQQAWEHGKAVFVEKPLAIGPEELRKLVTAHRKFGRPIMVGFNRRFSPLARRAKEFISSVPGPIAINCRVNAGPIPADHWIQDPLIGGGRIIGEVCHFVDLIHFLSGDRTEKVFAQALVESTTPRVPPDNVMINIGLRNGSAASIQYLSAGDPSYPKERVEIFGHQAVAVIDDFKTLVTSREGKTHRIGRRQQDKGHGEELKGLVTALLQGKELPVSFEEAVLTTLVTFQIMESLREGQPMNVDLDQFMDAR